MGRIVVTEFVSLDGVMEDPGGSEHSKHGAWTFKFSRGEEGDKFKFDEVNNAEAQLLGRDRKSTRLNSSHPSISYAVFCLKHKNHNNSSSTKTKKKKQ